AGVPEPGTSRATEGHGAHGTGSRSVPERDHNAGMFASCRAVRAVVALGLLAAALAACSGDSEASLPTPSKAFCQAAYDYDTNLPKLIGKIDQQTAVGQSPPAHPPRDCGPAGKPPRAP